MDKTIVNIFALLLMFVQFNGPLNAQTFKVIVNDSNPDTSLNRDQISRFFLKKNTAFANGQIVFPVDQVDDSAVRQIFTREIHRRSVNEIKAYWQRQIFSGRGVPPVEIESDIKVILYVQENPGAIGYISASMEVKKYKVKVINLKK